MPHVSPNLWHHYCYPVVFLEFQMENLFHLLADACWHHCHPKKAYLRDEYWRQTLYQIRYPMNSDAVRPPSLPLQYVHTRMGVTTLVQTVQVVFE